MPVSAWNAEHQFLHVRDQFIDKVQLEIDAIMTRNETSPFRLALAYDNLTDLIYEVRVVENASVTMYREMPQCRTVRDGHGYYGYNSEFLWKIRQLQGHLVVLKNSLHNIFDDWHCISRQVGAVGQCLDL